MKSNTIQVSEDQHMTFTGDLLSSASSRVPGRDRWMEINIFTTDDDKYVVQKIGRTILAGERDYFSAHVADDAQALVAALRSKKRGIVFTPIVAEDAIRDAMEKDSSIREAWTTVRI